MQRSLFGHPDIHLWQYVLEQAHEIALGEFASAVGDERDRTRWLDGAIKPAHLPQEGKCLAPSRGARLRRGRPAIGRRRGIRAWLSTAVDGIRCAFTIDRCGKSRKSLHRQAEGLLRGTDLDA